MGAIGSKVHWECIYSEQPATEVSWYRDHLDTSLVLINQIRLHRRAEIIDIGGGASTLVDDLLRSGFHGLTVLDISATALERAKARLANAAQRVRWIEGDVTSLRLPESNYDLWHDRAVFHFLTDARDRNAYVESATRSVKSAGFLIVATFARNGPTRCSGLPVERYGPEELARQFEAFEPRESKQEQHQTPSGAVQSFTYVVMRKRAG